MVANGKQFDADKTYQRRDVLRAKDIIPGARRSQIENEGGSDIPQFDLAEDIMAEQRRLIAAHRKGPSSVVTLPTPVVSRWTMDERRETPLTEWDPVIADIVAKDIERLCGSGSYA